MEATVVLRHLIHCCQQTEASRETLLIQTVARAVEEETLVQVRAGVETVNMAVVVEAIAGTKALVVMGETAAYTAVAVAAALVTQIKDRAVMVAQDETVRLRVVKVTEMCLAVAEAVIQLRDKTQPRYKEEMVVMAWIHAEWAWNLKGKDSVAQASNLLNMEVLVAVVEATAVTAEVLKQVAVVAQVVAVTAQKAETMTQVVKAAQVEAEATVAKAETVAIPIFQAAVLVVAEDMA